MVRTESRIFNNCLAILYVRIDVMYLLVYLDLFCVPFSIFIPVLRTFHRVIQSQSYRTVRCCLVFTNCDLFCAMIRSRLYTPFGDLVQSMFSTTGVERGLGNGGIDEVNRLYNLQNGGDVDGQSEPSSQNGVSHAPDDGHKSLTVGGFKRSGTMSAVHLRRRASVNLKKGISGSAVNIEDVDERYKQVFSLAFLCIIC